MKLFLIFTMQSHGGNIKKCDCIGRFFYVPASCGKVRIMQYKKNADDHGDNRITKPGSKQLMEHPHSVTSNNAPPLATIMARCPDPQIAQQPLLLKKTPIFT